MKTAVVESGQHPGVVLGNLGDDAFYAPTLGDFDAVVRQRPPNPWFCHLSPIKIAYSATSWLASATNRPTPASLRCPFSSISATMAISRS